MDDMFVPEEEEGEVEEDDDDVVVLRDSNMSAPLTARSVLARWRGGRTRRKGAMSMATLKCEKLFCGWNEMLSSNIGG